MVLLPPHVLSCGLEYAVHEVPRRHSQEIAATLPGITLQDLLIVTTSQYALQDLVRMGEEVELEKDRLLEKMRSKLNGSVYSEVDAFSTLLGYKTANAGCCKVLLHPRWGSRVYPASLFTGAPLKELQAAIESADAIILKQEATA